MINNFEYEVLTDEELSSVVGGSTASNIKDGMYIGAIFGGVKGAIAGGVLGWAFTPTKVS
ncbi:Blp family class II bacteriocin [Streptococcus agalactiae]|uniref:Bacteriocin class II with double-glycine leader peptide n=1 Tax=Streptococcus agalactiae TaxID=1311 RepID=A0A7Z7KA11_STRAG|nr:Blp family class II bacteriocin [Streptococcus agalactiae]MCC9873748.1 bacteriocin [Streptococcus agalactiae]MCC9878894.1 bacteriocin [Streptococcus agalactiae]PHU33487.1 bacteriocin leader domain-containing protein [Streptococcus agalactiae]PHU33494.1 bacteriocin leader domain-containing protein [Streptococcus agalactiae]SQA20051.1 Bacteriocin class II with double-glycine leader peptide [Streptococcus agalactiae]